MGSFQLCSTGKGWGIASQTGCVQAQMMGRKALDAAQWLIDELGGWQNAACCP